MDGVAPVGGLDVALDTRTKDLVLLHPANESDRRPPLTRRAARRYRALPVLESQVTSKQSANAILMADKKVGGLCLAQSCSPGLFFNSFDSGAGGPTLIEHQLRSYQCRVITPASAR